MIFGEVRESPLRRTGGDFEAVYALKSLFVKAAAFRSAEFAV